GKRRLQEEMGFICELEEVTSFIYKAPFDNGLTEHELDHIMIGYYNNNPKLNKEEVESFKWMTLEDVKMDMEEQPEIYTEWFKIIFDNYYSFITK
ncbi:NUDIX domain-containing protein, partial [Sphaerochaeta sp. S2]|uniref:NUDIX domain-containing protein n=1 Tax=Sphaerochaeta sp. S2 TaxID=2798868 RepID=UPI0018E96794